MAKEFKVPELGEEIKTATVLNVFISKGDQVALDQSVVELETEKAALEVPSDVEGTVEEVRVQEGEEVKIGQILFTLAGEKEDAPETEKNTKGAKTPKQEKTPGKKSEEKPKESENKEEKTKEKEKPSNTQVPVPAAPSVRRFAREIGIDVENVKGTGPNGRISIEDVKAYAKSIRETAGRKAPAEQPLPDFSQWGEVERKPMSKVRRLTAERVYHAWSAIPHVTQFGRADVTEIEELRKRYKSDAEKAGGKLTLTAILIKTVGGALKAFPSFNAAVDMGRGELIQRHYYNVGVAMDTDRGLLVPVIRDVDRKNLIELSVELAGLAGKARSGKLGVDDMRGGCFTISNLGALKGDAFTPIINWPEAAILGVGQSRLEAVFENGKFEPRSILPLSLSYDHRIIDGADGVRFLNWIVEALEEPVKMLWEG